MNERPQIKPRETIIATLSCDCCGKDVFVKTDKNGRAYSVCRWPTVETGLACGDQRRFSKKRTDQMVAAFYEKHTEKQKDERRAKAKEDNPETATQAKPERGGNFLGC